MIEFSDFFQRVISLFSDFPEIIPLRFSPTNSTSTRRHDADEVIADAVPSAQREIRQADLDRLAPHQEVIYEIIEEVAEISPGDLQNKYEDRVERPRSKRTVRTYLNKLEHYGLIESSGQTRQHVYTITENEDTDISYQTRKFREPHSRTQVLDARGFHCNAQVRTTSVFRRARRRMGVIVHRTTGRLSTR